MNSDTNKSEQLQQEQKELEKKIKEQIAGAIYEGGEALTEIKVEHENLLRPNGQPVPKHWITFTIGEDVVIKDYTFRVAYIGESNILFEPVGPVLFENKQS